MIAVLALCTAPERDLSPEAALAPPVAHILGQILELRILDRHTRIGEEGSREKRLCDLELLARRRALDDRPG